MDFNGAFAVLALVGGIVYSGLCLGVVWQLAFVRDDLSVAARVGWAAAVLILEPFGLVAYFVFSRRVGVIRPVA